MKKRAIEVGWITLWILSITILIPVTAILYIVLGINLPEKIDEKAQIE
jgi:hypothetical protein